MADLHMRWMDLPGPTGEANVLEYRPRGVVACIADDEHALVVQARAALALGNTALLLRNHISMRARDGLPEDGVILADRLDADAVDLVLLDALPSRAAPLRALLAEAKGKIVPVVMPGARGEYDWRRLVIERTVTINTAAAGGNTALLSLPDDA